MRTIHRVGIRGAGLSGLSIARELLRRQPGISISIFDLRPRLPHPQRTFCFFHTDEAFCAPCPTLTWQSVTFRGRSFERRIEVPMTPYTMIRGDDFFESILKELESLGVSFYWSCAHVDIDGDTIQTDGRTLKFDRVVDAAFQPSTASSLLWQSFGGVWVRSASPVFDPTTAILMDLQESSESAPVSFLYVLPTSPTTALIEHTTFSPAPLPPEHHLEHCTSWMQRHIGQDIEILEHERGAIPMGLRTLRPNGRYVTGSNAGAVRPATGYAFLAIQRHSRSLSERILRRTTDAPEIYPRWLKAGDQLFLQALANSPTDGGTLLENLLSRSPAHALVAFLSGNASFGQALSVWLSVPKLAMIKALLRI
jgi:lycopene beta-cyclase